MFCDVWPVWLVPSLTIPILIRDSSYTFLLLSLVKYVPFWNQLIYFILNAYNVLISSKYRVCVYVCVSKYINHKKGWCSQIDFVCWCCCLCCSYSIVYIWQKQNKQMKTNTEKKKFKKNRKGKDEKRRETTRRFKMKTRKSIY